MMEYNYTPSQHKNTAKCRQKYQLVITNILMGMIQCIHVVNLK